MAKGDIKEVNGFKYSRESFEGYKHRAIITLTDFDTEYKFDFYTTNTEKIPTFNDILGFIKRGTNIKMVHWASKEQDDAATKLIEETFDIWERKAKLKEDLQRDNQSTNEFDIHESY